VSDTPANPFVGLRPFEADDSLLFFGRQQQAAELMRRLHDERFVAVVGSSGCGKSSLVRAGLIPTLHAGFLVDDRDVWHVGTMKPGDSPIENLASALLTDANGDRREKAQALAREIAEGGAQAVLDATSPLLSEQDTNILLLVDQFEELFRFDQDGSLRGDGEAAADFVSVMLDLASQRAAPVYVIMTMRSDFLGDCDRFLGLPEAMNRSQYLVPRLSRQQRREAIEGPVRLYGQEIASRLTDRLLNESIDTRDDLPVLQHALMRTWDNWQRDGQGPIDVPHYEAVGTIHEALSRDAEAALEGMTERQLYLTKRLFQSLTTVDSGGRRIRKPARLDEVATRGGASGDDMWSVIQRFRTGGRSFLVASSEQPKDNPLLDISHESLIRQWGTLGKWVDAEADSIATYKRLAETALLHEHGRAGLYRDPDLQMALDWEAQEAPDKGWAMRHHQGFAEAIEFLHESKRVRDQAWVKAELERRWRTPRLGIVALVLALFFFNLGSPQVKKLWDGAQLSIKTAVENNTPKPVRESGESDRHFSLREKDRIEFVDDIGGGLADMIRVSAHLLLFLALGYFGKRLYKAYAFGAVLKAAGAPAKKKVPSRDSKMKKARRIIEEAAKWTSIIAGTLLLGTCTLAGKSVGAAGLAGGVFVGLVMALLLVGWVFAVARLNADVKAIRKDMEKSVKPDPGP